MRLLACSVASFALFACGGTITSGDAGPDAAAPPDASPPDAGSFCSGSAPRLVINGSEVQVVSATGKAIILNCCDSAELTLATSAYQALLDVMWRNPASTNGATIDLASAPSGFAIEMDLGCDPSTTSCANGSPEERYTDGFTGTLDYTTGSGGLTTTYCIQVAESPSQPHSIIHSMQLYAPNVVAQ